MLMKSILNAVFLDFSLKSYVLFIHM